MKEYVFLSSSEEDTIELGKKIAGIAKRGDTFALEGTLGMGKSVLARAFIQKLTAAKEVPSPTFTLLQSYQAPNFEVFHYDLYRLKSPEEIFELGVEEALYNGVCLIEWPEKMGAYIPNDIIKINIMPTETGRKITITAHSAEKEQRLGKLL